MKVLKGALGMGRGSRGSRDPGDAVRGLGDLLGDAVVVAEAGRRLFRGDGALLNDEPPAAVVLPGDEGQLVEAARYCHAHGLPMVTRGGATSLRGGAIGGAQSVVIATTRLNQIIDVNRRDRLVRAEAGATLTALGAAAGRAGLRLPVAPKAPSPATLGGAIAKNTQMEIGSLSGAIGGIVEGLRLVAANGEIVEIGAEVQACGGYDLAGLIAGSEGAFGIISEATLRLMPAAPAVRLMIARFSDEDAALAAAEALVQHRLVRGAVEVVGGRLWDGQSAGLGDWSAAESETFVLVEIEGFDEEVEAAAQAVADVMRDGARGSIEETADDAVRRAVWALRETAPARLARDGVAGVSDIVVPIGRIGEVSREMRQIASRHGLACVALVKPARGGIESVFVATGTGEESSKKVQGAIDEAVQLAGNVGGLAVGTLGAGALKAASPGYGGLEPSAFSMQQRVKAVFDGEGVMNPDKVLAPIDD